MKSYTIILLVVFLSCIGSGIAQQIQIQRIEQMPNSPQPYLMRNWENVAKGYDSLVFDADFTGQYVPLYQEYTNTVNYPGNKSFRLHTVVGTNSPNSGEAINCIAAIIGATLCGIDKANQNGNNYALMSQEWFNNRPEQNIYKNHPVDNTFDDFWYESFPNILFYQLYDLYPETGEFETQFISVADQWLKAVEAMNGKTTPWNVPNINYRGFDFATMTPYASGVIEPEAAGAIAWLLYHAYKTTKQRKYLAGAELCMEFINAKQLNPSYEVQWAYGTYIAAKMNAELDTQYDMEKFMNWCFDVGPLRNWGAIVGSWGGYDVSGLIGEVNGTNDYAFAMNTFEQFGALVPAVRYDERFARAIGKWALNAANAARLFYTNYLPDKNQDSEEWGHVYDPYSYLSHEAIRELKYGNSPYATGDAIDGGWGATNYTLYSSSHVGILGAIIDTTNIPQILLLDLLKTDYYGDEAYPSYLLYNPYNTEQTVELNIPNGSYDIYDAVTNQFILQGASGTIALPISPDNAIIAVYLPTGSTIVHNLNRSFADGVCFDYNNGQPVSNYPPRIKSLSANKTKIAKGTSVSVFCTATDREDENLNYLWSAENGVLTEENDQIIWTASSQTGIFEINCIVEDNQSVRDTALVEIEVVDNMNLAPVIYDINASPRKINVGHQSNITCNASDPEEQDITFFWTAEYGSISGSGSSIVYTAPMQSGDYYVLCEVADEYAKSAKDSILVRVRDFSNTQTGQLLAFYPFSGDADDASGNNQHGVLHGVAPTTDRFNNGSSAYRFDGINDYILVPNTSLLNFRNSITISAWITVEELFDREAYIISHGNWEHRWKISVTDDHIRWTVKSNSGIKDIDSETILSRYKLYNIVAIYDGSDFELYINGELDAFSSFNGLIESTNIDLTIGQVLPSNNQYNFKGVIDDVRIYDYALPDYDVRELFDITTDIKNDEDAFLPTTTKLLPGYPNPFNMQTIISYQLGNASFVQLEIYDILGKKIKSLVNQHHQAGYYSVDWDGKDDNNSVASAGVYLIILKTNTFIFSQKILLLK